MKKNNGIVLTLFMLGIFMGAIDSGIVSPAREIIQNSFGVERNLGVWMITLYTLSYAIAMPIVSKLADRYGYKKVYLLSISLFALGSFFVGISNFMHNFSFMLLARVIQAIGGGGIVPIATTVISQSFPEEKKGTALGIVGGIYGVATILGPSLGSFILSFSGNNNWGWLFFINIPISAIILLMSGALENSKGNSSGKLDIAGSIVLGGAVGSLMYALTNINFFDIANSIQKTDVYPFMIAFVLLMPALFFIEKRASDPVLNIKYFSNRQMILTMLLSFIVGIGMMGMVFVPQFAENTLKIKAGSGGYLVTILAIFSGVAAPLSGILLDKKGAAFVLSFGFLFTIGGSLFLGFVATQYLNFITILIGISLMGLGVGFTLGAPLNYLVLKSVPKEENATALATMSLIRSIGVTISPSLMIGFIVEAAKNLQGNLMDTIKNSGLSMPSNMGGNNSKAAELFSSLQSADVTTIVDNLKNIFTQLIPKPFNLFVNGNIEKLRPQIETTFQATLNNGYTDMFVAASIIAALGLVVAFVLGRKMKKAEKESFDIEIENQEI